MNFKIKNITAYFLTLFLIGSIVACSGNGEIEDDPNTSVEENFKVHGKIEGASNTKIYLEAISNQGTIKVAEGETDGSGDFEMIGNIPGMGIYQLRLGESNDKIIPLTMIPKDNVEITTSFDQFHMTPKFEGTEWAESLTKYMQIFSDFAAKQQELGQLQGQISDDELIKRFNALKKPMDDFCKSAMTNDADNPVNIILSSSMTPNQGFKYWDGKNLDILKKVSKAFKKRFADSPITATLENQVFQIESAYKEYQTFLSGNMKAPEISLNNPDGKNIKLSSLKGKVVLIDFWASWCGPCRKENPNVVKLYNQYKDNGFTILSVSLDEDINAWKQAIKEDGLIWPNHVSDLKGWKTELTKVYGFQSIPHTVLVNKEGKIVEVGLRGENLEQKLKELLSK